MTAPLVIYHDNCADGFGAAFAAWVQLGDDAEFYAARYSEGSYLTLLRQIPVEGREVYVLDFSFPRQDMRHLFEKASYVTWLDHHKTAFEMWCPKHGYDRFTQNEYNGGINPVYCDIVLDNNKSGAYLAWEFFHPRTKVPTLFRHIDDYDRWQFKIKGTKAFNKALWSYAPWNFKQWKEICFNPLHGVENVKDAYDSFLIEGEAILRAHNQNVQAVVKGNARHCEIWKLEDNPGGMDDLFRFPGLSANCPAHLSSDVGHELSVLSGTYGLCWGMNKDGKAICQLRGNGKYDVSALAKMFGGGGHKNASGFETDMATLQSWLK